MCCEVVADQADTFMSCIEEMVQCPYDKHHVILKSRLILHLYKCKKQHPDKEFSICPFNASHHVPTRELECHSEVCPDRNKLDSYLYVVGDERRNDNLKIPKVNAHSSENWDEEPQANASYLDLIDEINLKRQVLRRPTGTTRSERKTFYVKEFKRLESFDEDEVCDKTSETSSRFETGVIPKSLAREITSGEAHRLIFVQEDEIRAGRKDELSNNADFCAIVLNRGRGRGLPSSTVTKI